MPVSFTAATVMEHTARSGTDAMLQRRKARWLYLLPVALAPTAHIFVTAAHTFPTRRKMFLGLVALATAGAVYQRLWLMEDAGYPAGSGQIDEGRFVKPQSAQERPRRAEEGQTRS